MLQISNPLRSALARYETELVDTLTRIKLPHAQAETLQVEGGKGPLAKMANLRAAIANTRAGATEPNSEILHIWPSLGTLDGPLWQIRRGRATIVYHDPVPIRQQVGYDRVSKLLSARLTVNSRVRLLTHSREAQEEVHRLFPKASVEFALHPVVSERRLPARLETTNTAVAKHRNELLVAGQFKPERDLELMKHLAKPLKKRGVDLRIVGRGWPQIDGWHVEDRFVSESRLDSLLASASAVLIPYKKYFQSGIAVRAIENGTIPILPKSSFATDLLSTYVDMYTYDSVGDIEKLAENISTIQFGPSNAEKILDTYRAAVDDSWRAMLPWSGQD